MRLGVLDQSPVSDGRSAVDALHETIALAKAADEAGYHRYWLAEHHATTSLAGPAPEIMVTRIAMETSHIRVGTGGVMLSHYSPLKVAETFRVLEALYPGRIDLGIGRAPGSDQLTAAALAYGSEIGIEYFPARIADMVAFLTDSAPPTEAFSRIDVSPKIDTLPETWLLGSSDQSALYAAKFGLAFSFAQFIAPVGGDRVMDAYRQNFQPSSLFAEPVGSIGTFMICAETEDAAKRLGASRDLVSLRRVRGIRAPFPSVEEALSYPYTDEERAYIESQGNRGFYGDPDQCRAHLRALAETYGVNEIVVLTICHDPVARRHSYELLAEAVALQDA